MKQPKTTPHKNQLDWREIFDAVRLWWDYGETKWVTLEVVVPNGIPR